VRICSTQHGISPAAHLGGAVYDREILQALAKIGVNVHILLPRGMDHPRVQEWVIHDTAKHWVTYYEYNLLFLAPLLRLWREVGFDLLRIHSPAIALGTVLFRRLTGVPTVAHHHHLEDDRRHRLLTLAMATGSHRVITGSQHSRQHLIAELNVSPSKVAVVPYGVAGKYHPGGRSAPCGLGTDDRTVIFYLGSLKPRKNLPFLLEVFQDIHVKRPDTLLVIGGTGPQEEELKDRVRQLGLSRAVMLTGYIPESEKVDYYNGADIFVLPSRLEGFGLVAAEAMACGKPVVASNVCSLPEIVVDGTTGFLADPDDVDDFSDKILRLVRNDDLRHKMGSAGRARARSQFSWDAAAARTKAIYERVIAGSEAAGTRSTEGKEAG